MTSEKDRVITIKAPEGMKFVQCTECGNPCVQDIESDSKVCTLCTLMNMDTLEDE